MCVLEVGAVFSQNPSVSPYFVQTLKTPNLAVKSESLLFCIQGSRDRVQEVK